jgi:hypothetical protein
MLLFGLDSASYANSLVFSFGSIEDAMKASHT